MTRIEAWYRRKFCNTCDYYGYEELTIGDCFVQTRYINYIYVGKNKFWIKKVNNIHLKRPTE